MTTARERATARYRLAAETLDSVFDLADQLAVSRAELATLAGSPADDLVDNAVAVLAAASKVSTTLDALRGAAVDALEFTSQRQLASDLGTRPALLFPPPPSPVTRTEHMNPPVHGEPST